MQKLIKLNDQHYIIVDDSEIKVGDWYLTFMNNKIIGEPRKCSDDSYNFSNCKKITHSTQPLGTPLLFTNAFESELSLSINGLNETFIENCKGKRQEGKIRGGRGEGSGVNGANLTQVATYSHGGRSGRDGRFENGLHDYCHFCGGG